MDGKDREQLKELDDILENRKSVEAEEQTEALRQVGVSDMSIQMRKEINSAKTVEEKLAVRRKYMERVQRMKRERGG